MYDVLILDLTLRCLAFSDLWKVDTKRYCAASKLYDKALAYYYDGLLPYLIEGG
jgi:hypothetical protein